MHVYFSGIGGVGIGPLAMLALDAGYSVSGSDLAKSAMTEALTKRGVAVHIGKQSDEHIMAMHQTHPIDWFVYSSALPSSHPELVYAHQVGMTLSKRASFLNKLLLDKRLMLIAIAGTHGKTTTTGMLIWLFKQLNVPISYSIGTSINYGESAKYDGASDYFVYECDEFDRNFLAFHPTMSVIPSIDYDHPDTYPTIDDYWYAFEEFVGKSTHSILLEADAKTLSLSPSATNTIVSENDPGIDRIRLAGTHTRRNAWLAICAMRRIYPEIEVDRLIELMNTFPGTSRRFEMLGNHLYSDYGHHPTEIKATIAMAKELNPDVTVVYQPHQNIRQHDILAHGGYGDCFEQASATYVLDTYLSREDPKLEVLSPEQLIASTTTPTSIAVAHLDSALWNVICEARKKSSLVLCMSAGDLDQWLRNQLMEQNGPRAEQSQD